MKRLVQIFAAAVIFLVGSGTAAAANWQLIFADDTVSYFFDTDSVRFEKQYDARAQKYVVDAARITCWVKTMVSQQEADKAAAYFKDPRFHRMLFYKTLSTYDWQQETWLDRTVVFYDTDGSVLRGSDLTDAAKPAKIAPDTRQANIFYAVCRYAVDHQDELVRNTFLYEERT